MRSNRLLALVLGVNFFDLRLGRGLIRRGSLGEFLVQHRLFADAGVIDEEFVNLLAFAAADARAGPCSGRCFR